MFGLSKIIEKKLFLEYVGNDMEHFDTIIHLFKEQSEDTLKRMREALRQEDSSAFGHAAHDLKNLGRNIAANPIIDHSRALEEHAANEQLSMAAEMLDKTEKLLRRAQKELVSIRNSF